MASDMNLLPGGNGTVRRLFKGGRPIACACMAIALAACFAGGCRREAPTDREPVPAVRTQPGEAQAAAFVPLDETPEAFTQKLWPEGQALRSWTGLRVPLERSLKYVRAHRQDRLAVNSQNLKLTWGDLRETLERLLELLPALDANPKLFLSEFEWLPVGGGILYSSYHEPLLDARRKPDAKHSMPIYAMPKDIQTVKQARGKYWTRAEIDGLGALEGKGLELAWADPVDVFFLQVQGSGLLAFPDGTVESVLYAGQNGWKYKSSKRILMERGANLDAWDIESQRQWFKEHPDQVQDVLFANPSYVFFKRGDRRAVGAINQPMTAWTSLASDPKRIPLGAVCACGVALPFPRKTVSVRFIGLAQDTGGAIKGNRFDLFSGSGRIADWVAAKLDAAGPAWVLVRKHKERAER